MYQRVRELLAGPLALYAAHLPLDLHAELGNNAALARQLKLKEIEPFGEYSGIKIGYKGILAEPLSLDAFIRRLGLSREECLAVLPFGKEEIRTVGIVSGGAASSLDVNQALDENLDLYLTGEVSHQIYHYCLEGGFISSPEGTTTPKPTVCGKWPDGSPRIRDWKPSFSMSPPDCRGDEYAASFS